jgi:hypothetical protein
MAIFYFFLYIGAIFGFLAALIAFFITYIEWRRHKFTGWKLWREALIRATFTFAFFFLLSVAIGWGFGMGT